MDGPLLWYLNRSTGAVLLLLFTISVVLGILATRGNAGGKVPRFVTQEFHRNISLLSLTLLVAHIATAVADEYVDIRWWDALVPWGSPYMEVWLALGTIAFDLTLIVVATSLVRHRMNAGLWRGLHLMTYVAWFVALLHGWGIGTDAQDPWMLWLQGSCAVAFVSAVSVRLATRSIGPSPESARWEAGAR
jgi:predicted ferric reductase